MAGPAKTTGAVKHVRVQLGSALERMTDGKPFTEAVHRMAELFEKALEENWGPQPQPEIITQVGSTLVEDYVWPKLGEETGGQGFYHDDLQTRIQIGHDERSAQVVTEAELLVMAREQFPSGLVPVGLDEGDGEPAETSTEPMEPADPDDLSYLV